MKRFKEAWQKIRQTNARIKADRRNQALDEWRRSHPKEYASWLSAGCPAIFICRQLDE